MEEKTTFWGPDGGYSKTCEAVGGAVIGMALGIGCVYAAGKAFQLWDEMEHKRHLRKKAKKKANRALYLVQGG